MKTSPTMKQAVLIHNPTAGSGEHDKQRLITHIESAGYEVRYYSTKFPGWEKFVNLQAELIFLAGGDGTVQKLAAALLKAGGSAQKTPVQLLPMGTANNIATTLGLRLPLQELVKLQDLQSFDMGKVEGAGEPDFFIEGLGFGIFPKLVQVMETKEKEQGEPEEPEEELKQSLEELITIIKDYEAHEAIIIADKEEISGKFLLVELMNIKYIGPNFELAPTADTGDGKFDLVAVPEDARQELIDYVQNLLENNQNKSVEDFALLKKVEKVQIKWFGEHMHIDDERISYNGEAIKAKNVRNAFNLRTPAK